MVFSIVQQLVAMHMNLKEWEMAGGLPVEVLRAHSYVMSPRTLFLSERTWCGEMWSTTQVSSRGGEEQNPDLKWKNRKFTSEFCLSGKSPTRFSYSRTGVGGTGIRGKHVSGVELWWRLINLLKWNKQLRGIGNVLHWAKDLLHSSDDCSHPIHNLRWNIVKLVSQCETIW